MPTAEKQQQRKGGFLSRFRKKKNEGENVPSQSENGEEKSTPLDVAKQGHQREPIPKSPVRVANANTKKATLTASSASSPQELLSCILSEQGYMTARIPALHSSCCYSPSDFQKACYTDLDMSSTIPILRFLLQNSGISRNPAHPTSGDSWLHQVCRAGDLKMLNGCFLNKTENEALLHCINHSGETILHAACQAKETPWAVVQAICDFAIANDSFVMAMWNHVDATGKTPLECTRPEDEALWKDFLVTVQDSYWATGGRSSSLVTTMRSQAAPLPCPPNGLPMALARKVADRSLKAEEAWLLVQADDDDDDDDSDDDDDEDSTEHEKDPDGSTFADESTANTSRANASMGSFLNTQEMNQVLTSMSGKK